MERRLRNNGEAMRKRCGVLDVRASVSERLDRIVGRTRYAEKHRPDSLI